MPRMLDLIRNSEVPSSLMHSAARGSLAVPAGEIIEILVYLALHHKAFGEEARLTLAGWDEKASLAAASDPATSAEVLGYLVAPENLRPGLLAALADNPSVSEESLDRLAVSGARPLAETLMGSQRVMSSPALLQALQTNANLRPTEIAEIGDKLAALEASRASESHLPGEADASDDVVEGMVTKYLAENAAELAVTEKDKPFQPVGTAHESANSHAGEAGGHAAAGTGGASAGAAKGAGGKSSAAAAVAVHARKHATAVHEERRDSALQKISKLDIKGRIALAMRGSKEDRSILVRDSTKLVAVAVLDSPKLSEAEVEAFALQKNVLESVLRAIPLRRKFAKNYNIMRNLVQNPRTPIDTSLPLMKTLLVHDLKNLSTNKDVSDTIRKVAMRLYRQKAHKD